MKSLLTLAHISSRKWFSVLFANDDPNIWEFKLHSVFTFWCPGEQFMRIMPSSPLRHLSYVTLISCESKEVTQKIFTGSVNTTFELALSQQPIHARIHCWFWHKWSFTSVYDLSSFLLKWRNELLGLWLMVMEISKVCNVWHNRFSKVFQLRDRGRKLALQIIFLYAILML